MSEWQPIETAPRNGQWILVTGFKSKKKGPVNHTCVVAGWFPVSIFKPEIGHQWFYGTRGGEFIKDPTHWMALPDIPANIRKPAKIKNYIEVVTFTRRATKPSVEYLKKRTARNSVTEEK